MTDDIEIECPECGHTETASVGPMISISADLDVTVKSVECWNCGYEGEA